MTLETTSFAEGAIEVMFLQQQGRDRFAAPPERTAQIKDVATRIAHFIGEAKSTIDIEIYDFRLRDEAATIVADGLRSQAQRCSTRIVYDNATDPGTDAISTAAPSHLESDQKPIEIDSFVRSFVDVAQVKGITGYRVLMHNKYILRDVDSVDAAVFTGSSNYTSNSWGFRITTCCVCVRSNWLHTTQRILSTFGPAEGSSNSIGFRDTGTVRLNGVPVAVAFTPGESPAVLKEIVGAIAAARNRLYVASVVLSSGPILAALRGGAGTPRGGASPHPRRGPAHRRQRREAAGLARQAGSSLDCYGAAVRQVTAHDDGRGSALECLLFGLPIEPDDAGLLCAHYRPKSECREDGHRE